VSLGWSANTLNQIPGRLVRIGQRRFVEWEIFLVAHTIYEKHEEIMWRKYSRQLAAEGIIDTRIQGELGLLVCYELICGLYKQPCSRYLLETLEVGTSSICDGFLREMSNYISIIARLAIQHPEDCHLLNSFAYINYIACSTICANLGRSV